MPFPAPPCGVARFKDSVTRQGAVGCTLCCTHRKCVTISDLLRPGIQARRAASEPRFPVGLPFCPHGMLAQSEQQHAVACSSRPGTKSTKSTEKKQELLLSAEDKLQSSAEDGRNGVAQGAALAQGQKARDALGANEGSTPASRAEGLEPFGLVMLPSLPLTAFL